ncbi:MAG: hypothetical protein ACRDD7_08960 [Peptostreptococcaceae bacterium]
MNNILNLYSIEFKRIYKLYLGLLGVLLLGNIYNVSSKLNSIIHNVAEYKGIKPSINLLKLDKGKEFLFNRGIRDIEWMMNVILGLCVIMCLIYAVAIWYRDFLGRSKTGYTLFMLPINKFNVYIAKAITVVTMIFGIILAQMIFNNISYLIIGKLSELNVIEVVRVNNDIYNSALKLIQTNFIDFIMINILGVILAVIVIFTGVMIQKSFKLIGFIVAPAYVIGSIYMYLYISQKSLYTDELFIRHSIYYIVLFGISIGISYVLLNKKVHV